MKLYKKIVSTFIQFISRLKKTIISKSNLKAIDLTINIYI